MTDTSDEQALKQIVAWMSTFQREWFNDRSKKKIWLKARQLGATEISVAEAVYHCGLHDDHTFYLIKQTRESASNELLSRAKNTWIPAFQCVPSLKNKLQVVKSNTHEVVFANGSRLASAACNPQKLRGEVASFLFDEADHLETRHLEKLPDAIFPTIDNPLNPNCVLRLISTPWIKDRLFHQIWEGEYGEENWRRFETDIHDAIEEGYPLDFDEIQEQYRSKPEALKREYLCEWSETSFFYFNHRVIEQCHTPSNPTINEDTSKLVAGIDVGKKQDFTAVTFLHKDNSHYHVDKTYLIRRVSYEKIAQIAAELLSNYQPASALVDETANTAFLDSLKTKTAQHIDDLNEGYDEPPKQVTLREWWEPESDYDMPYIEGDRATNEKNQMRVDKLTECMDKAQFSYTDDVMVWNDDTEAFEPFPKSLVQYDLKHVKQETTRAGRPTYDVERTEEMGHGDVFSSILLALQACDTGQPDEIMMGVLH